MKIWLDAQLSPALAPWISKHYQIECCAVRDLNLRDAEDNQIFEQALKNNAIVMTKDSDFVHLAYQKDNSPTIIWVTVGNSCNKSLKKILKKIFPTIIMWLKKGEKLVEISD